MKNNPFGKGDPRFEYQKTKIQKEREGPTGDFNIHMEAVKDNDVLHKRNAIQNTLKFQKQVFSLQPNAVFTSATDRKPFDSISTSDIALLNTPSNVSAAIGNNPFKTKKGKGLFVGNSNSGELMINLGTSTKVSSNRKLDASRTTITDTSILQSGSKSFRMGTDPGFLMPADFTGELA